MPDFINPYQFVPVTVGPGNPRVGDLQRNDFDEGNVGNVTHDRFVAGTYSGRVICSLETRDPVVVGGEQDQTQVPAVVKPFMLNDRPAIPGTSLRGLVSSIVEAATNSAFRVLTNPFYSVRSRMDEFLPAIGMVVIEPDGRRALRPVALGPLTPSQDSLSAQIPPQFQGLFADPGGNYLKVYLNGYRPNNLVQPPELEFVPRSFLDDHRDANSYSADSQQFWYLQLAGSCHVAGGRIHCSHPLRIKEVRNQQGAIMARWALGQNALRPSDPRPITEAEWLRLDPNVQQTYTRGIVRILGLPPGQEAQLPITRKHELFIPYPEPMDTAACLPIPDNVWATFHTIANLRTSDDPVLPFHLQGSTRNGKADPEDPRIQLRTGDLLYFNVSMDPPNSISAIALSSIWRKEAGSCFEYFIRGFGHDHGHPIGTELLPFHRGRRTISIAEQIFGFVEDLKSDAPGDEPTEVVAGSALMGRARFSAAVLPPDQEPDWFDTRVPEDRRILKILSSPKPPSPNFYFQRRDAAQHTYIQKSSVEPGPFVPKGRKAYVHRRNVGSGQAPWYTQHTQEDLAQKLRVTPLRRGLRFYFDVEFQNFTREELAILVYALRPEPDFRHKIGLGKPLGLGAIQITPLGIFYVDRRRRYSEGVLGSRTARYHAGFVAEGCSVPAELYPRESQAAPLLAPGDQDLFPTLTALGEEGRASVPQQIRRALRVIGRESAATEPVHIPQLGGEDPEHETYRWFARNDDRNTADGQRQCLQPITGNYLPTLRD